MASGAPSKNDESTASFDDLSPETAVDILLRLPVKSLIRSTSVSKTWYSLIVNPNFISTQIRRSCCDENAVLIIPPVTSQKNYCSLVSADTSSLIENFDIPFSTRSGSLKLVSSLNGLLLLTDIHMHYNARDLYLWNPYVKIHKTLVSTCFKKLLDNLDKSYCIVGLGFHKATNDYRVVRIVYVEDDEGKQFGKVAPKVEIFSLRKHTWRKIKDTVVPRLALEYGAYVNGSYYWLEIKPFETEEERNSNLNGLWILSFDFDNELFGELKLPDEVPSCLGNGSRFKLMEFEGLLSLCVFNSNGVASHPYCIWLMRHENGVTSWTTRFSVVLKKGGWPMNITKSGTLIIESYPPGNFHVTSLLSCNLKSMQYKELGSSTQLLQAYCRVSNYDTNYRFVLAPSTVDTSFMESLVMYEGGKSLLKYAK